MSKPSHHGAILYIQPLRLYEMYQSVKIYVLMPRKIIPYIPQSSTVNVQIFEQETILWAAIIIFLQICYPDKRFRG